MAEIQIRASKVDRATMHEPGPLYIGVMRTGVLERSRDTRALEKPTFRTICEQGVWGRDEILRFAILSKVLESVHGERSCR